MAEQKSVLSSVIDTVKEAVTNTVETVKDYITPPEMEKPDNPTIYFTNRETGYEKYYTIPAVVSQYEKDILNPSTSNLPIIKEEIEKKVALNELYTEIHKTDQPSTKSTSKPILVDEINQTTDLSRRTTQQAQPPSVNIEVKSTEKKEAAADANIKKLEFEEQRGKVARMIDQAQNLLNKLKYNRDNLKKTAISQTQELQYKILNSTIEDKLSKVQTIADSLIPIQGRISIASPMRNDKYDIEIFELQLEELMKSVDQMTLDIQLNKQDLKFPVTPNINLSKLETPVKPNSDLESRLIEKEQEVIQAENIKLDKTSKQKDEETSPFPEPKIPFYDEKAPYARDLKQKAVELGFEVERTKDLDELIKETQEQM